MSPFFALALALALTACSDKQDPASTDDTASDTSDSGADTVDTVDTAPVDADGDGYTADVDCDDADGSINPGATEICNGIDDNCDGLIDEGVAQSWYTDADGDGFGDPASVTLACTAPVGAIADGTDCNDADPTIYPGAPEVCGDGLDTDCDGVDDACRADGEVPASTATATLMGEAGELAGARLSAGGDVDGDGRDDVWADLYGWGPSSADSSGAVMLVPGPVTGTHVLEDVATATLTGESAGDYAGWALHGGDDLDGDGSPDVAIGAYGYDGAGTGYVGAVYAVYGMVAGTTSLASADAVVTMGDAEVYYFGFEVSTSADVTGDSTGDVIVGSYGRYDDNFCGEAWIFPGPLEGALTLDDAITITGNHELDIAGNGLAGLGDVNGDGQADLVVGAHGDDSAGDAAGAAGLFYGPITGDLFMADADRTVTGEARSDELSRNSLAGSGDVDGDGYEDWLVGAPYHSAVATDAGAAYLISGTDSMTGILPAASATARMYDDQADAYFARSLSLPGDLDGDGFADVAVGSLDEDTSSTDSGAIFLWYGPVSGTLSTADANVVYTGEAAGDSLGISVAGAGDADGDGNPDLFMGAWFNDDNGESAGAAYLFP